MNYLLDNPLLAWELKRLRSERKAWLGAAAFALIYYGLIAFVVAIWLGSFGRPSVRNLLTTFHYLTWGVSGLLLLLWAPVRMAQSLAREKERGGLDALRLTGMTGLELAAATLVSALTFPAALALTTLPVALLGFGGDVSIGGVVRAYVALFLLAPVYTLLGGLAGLATRKAQQASSGAGVVAIGLLIVSGVGLSDPLSGPLALLGPWGTGLAAPRGGLFEVTLPGGRWSLPGDLLQIPLLVVLGRALLAGLARRLAGVPALLLGRSASVTVLAAACVVALVTLNGAGRSTAWPSWYRASAADEVIARLIVLWVFLLLCAFEAPIAWRDRVRGLARREPDDPVPADERLSPWRVLAPAAVFMGWTALTAAALVSLADGAAVAGLVGGAFVALTSACFAGCAAQAAILVARDRPFAWLYGGGVVAAFWFLPLVASGGLRAIGMPALLYELPQAINPLYGIYLACFYGRASTASGLAPMALATACVGWQLVGIATFVALTRSALRSARERADSLVALPADAFAPPGALDRTCPAGHRYSSSWAACPHCPAASSTPGPAGEAEPPASGEPAPAHAPTVAVRDLAPPPDGDAPTRPDGIDSAAPPVS